MTLDGISGTMFVHNAIQYDYCVLLALDSILPFCDEIILLECASDDGTAEILKDYAFKNPRVQIHQAKWEPGSMGHFMADLCNEARYKCSFRYHVHCQADEIFSNDSGHWFREAAKQDMSVKMQRLNFWITPRTIAPTNRICGDFIVRGAPVVVPSEGDAENLGNPDKFLKPPSKIFHYGFIRKPDAFASKAILMQEAFFNIHDPCLDGVKDRGLSALEAHLSLADCLPYDGPHPEAVLPWLRDRGHQI